jgi:hypothetical protein
MSADQLANGVDSKRRVSRPRQLTGYDNRIHGQAGSDVDLPSPKRMARQRHPNLSRPTRPDALATRSMNPQPQQKPTLRRPPESSLPRWSKKPSEVTPPPCRDCEKSWTSTPKFGSTWAT